MLPPPGACAGNHHQNVAGTPSAWGQWRSYLNYCLAMRAAKFSIGYCLICITVKRVRFWIMKGIIALAILPNPAFFYVSLLVPSRSAFWTRQGKYFRFNSVIAIKRAGRPWFFSGLFACDLANVHCVRARCAVSSLAYSKEDRDSECLCKPHVTSWNCRQNEVLDNLFNNWIAA